MKVEEIQEYDLYSVRQKVAKLYNELHEGWYADRPMVLAYACK